MTQSATFDLLDWPLSGMQLVEASAGTGKTWTLCALVLRLVLEAGRPIDEILVVTFTQAATAELSQRVRERLIQARTAAQARAQGVPAHADALLSQLLDRIEAQGVSAQTASERLAHALRNFDEAAIHTIHAYCQRALAEAPFAAGLPLDAPQVGEDQALVDEVTQDFWRRHLVDGEMAPAVVAHLRACGDSPERWSEWLKACCAKPLARRLWPDAVPTWEQVDRRVDDAPLHAALGALRQFWHKDPDGLARSWQAVQPHLNGNIYRKGRAERTWSLWAEVLRAERPVDWGEAEVAKDLSYMGWERLSGAVKKGGSLHPHPVFLQVDTVLAAAQTHVESLRRIRLCLVRHLLEWGAEELQRRKRERRLLAYDDMLSNLHRALCNDTSGQLAARLRARHPVALVDEFQDTDPQQYDIFERIYGSQVGGGIAHSEQTGDAQGSGLLFLVGDPKQAIYGFRNADLPTYLRARQRAQAVHRLDDNQRSAAPLLHAQNALFGFRADAFAQDGLSHPAVRMGAKPRARLRLGESPLPALTLWPLPDARDTAAQASGPGARRPTRLQARSEALAACADDIARLLSSGACIDGHPLVGGDVAVLVRTHREGRAMRNALAARGVPCVERSRESVWHSAESEFMTTLLHAVAQPRVLGLVRIALATPLLGWTADRIAALEQDQVAHSGVLAEFGRLHLQWQARGVGVMLQELQRGPLFSPSWLCGDEGDRRWTNWRHVCELLQAHEARERASPEGLIRWLRIQRGAARPGEDAQLRLESDADLVQVVTVHASKGLEYAVVYAPLLWAGVSRRGGKLTPWIERTEAGLTVLDFHPEAAREHADALAAHAHAEAMRLLYVALTRAVHRCVLAVGSYRANARVSDWGSCAQAPLNAWLLSPQRGASEAHALQVDGAWRDWADATQASWLAQGQSDEGPAVQWADWPSRWDGELALSSGLQGAVQLAALPAPVVPRGWRLSSYSALWQSAPEHDEGSPADHDALAPQSDELRDASSAMSPLLAFARGARAGECIHACFEHAVFSEPAQWPAAVDQALRSHIGVWDEGPRGDEPVAREHLLGMLHDVLNTPLPGAGALAQVPSTHARTEWEFHLSAPGLNPAHLCEVLRAQGVAVPELPSQDWGGYLRGFVDLVFFAHGRWHIVDWKSNHLGGTPADYAQPALRRAMRAAGYSLQAVLYQLALHRHLRACIPGYDPLHHLGQVYYLFVRGMGPARLDQDSQPLGVHVTQTSTALLHALDAAVGFPGNWGAGHAD